MVYNMVHTWERWHSRKRPYWSTSLCQDPVPGFPVRQYHSLVSQVPFFYICIFQCQFEQVFRPPVVTHTSSSTIVFVFLFQCKFQSNVETSCCGTYFLRYHCWVSSAPQNRVPYLTQRYIILYLIM